MEKKEILQFEADDASKTGINGKQVFFAKRINGQTIRNKEVEEESRQIENPKDLNNDKEELFIEFKNISYSPNRLPQKRNTANINNKKRKKNNRKVSSIKKKNNSKNISEKPAKKQNTSKRNKKRKNNKTLKIIFMLTAFFAIVIFALVSPIFNVEKFEVVGNEKIDTNTIISLSGIQEGKNIFQISKKNTINKIKENTYINDASVKRILPGTIQITVEERAVAYQIKVINSYVYIDYQGYILEVASKSAKVPLLEGISTDQDTLLNGKRLANNDIQLLSVILRIIETAKSAEIYDAISKITIKDKEYILELNKEKKIVYLGNAKNLTNQMTYVKLILEKEKKHKGKIFVNGDISNGFKPYFREE